MVMDEVFGYDNFRREIIWNSGSVSGFKSRANGWVRQHDTLLYYNKGKEFTFNKIYLPYKEDYLKKMFKYKDKDGRVYRKRRGGKQYLDESKGMSIGDVWVILSLQTATQSKEAMGYPTQKPEALLERIIKASSNEGDVVLDPFCGCGTTIVTSNDLNRHWIGIDMNNIAIQTIIKRCSQRKLDFPTPVIIERTLENIMAIINDKSKSKGYKFERWVNEFYNAKKPIDKGVDGITPDGIPIQTKTFKINDTIVNGFYGQAILHRDVPKPIKVIRLVSGEGYFENARQAVFEIENKGVKVELVSLKDMLK